MNRCGYAGWGMPDSWMRTCLVGRWEEGKGPQERGGKGTCEGSCHYQRCRALTERGCHSAAPAAHTPASLAPLLLPLHRREKGAWGSAATCQGHQVAVEAGAQPGSLAPRTSDVCLFHLNSSPWVFYMKYAHFSHC